MDQPLRILLIEDSVDDSALIEDFIKREGISFSSQIVESKDEYEDALQKFQPNVIISDHSLPQFNSMEALKIYKQYKEKSNLVSAFVLVTGTVSEEFAVESIKNGADDYILKDRLARLPSAILRALEKNMLEEQKRKIEDEKIHLLNVLHKSLHEIYLFNPETLLIEYANEEAYKNTGYSFEELKQMSPINLIEEFNEKNIKKILEGVKKSKKGRVYEIYQVRKDKSRYPAQIHLQLITQGQRKTFLVNVLDQTETKKQQQQKDLAMFIQNTFNESHSLEESFKIILKEICTCFDSLPAAEIWAKNFEESGIKRFAYYDVEQKSPSEAGVSLSQIALKNTTPIFRNLQEDKLYHKEKPIEENRFTSAMAWPIMWGKEVLAVVVVYSEKMVQDENTLINLGENVCDQLANNIKRKKSEEELSKIFELSPDALVVAGLDGYLKKVNPTFSKTLGFSSKEMLSTPYINFIHPEDWETELQLKENFRGSKKHINYYENRYKTKKGDYKWFAWSVTPFMDEELFFGIGKDITEQKKQMKAIQWQNEKFAEIAWEQSHVVRAPLTRMMGCIQHIEENEENRDELLKNIKSSAYELDEIIRKIVEKAEYIKTF